MILNISDLEKQRIERATRNHELYKSFFMELATKIKSRDALGHRNMIHTIPTIVVGFPWYDVNHALQYVITKLNHGGFLVFPWKDNYLYIDWSVVNNEIKETKKKKVKNTQMSNDDIDEMIRKINTQ